MKHKYFGILIVLVMLIVIIGFSFGYLRAERRSTNNQTITLSNFNVQLLTDMTTVTLNSALPVSDTEGVNGTATTFQVKNNSGVAATYKLFLADAELPEGKVRMQNSDVRYRLKRTRNNVTTTLDIKNLDASGLIDTESISANETISFELVCWIDVNANPNNQSFSKTLVVEGLQSETLDKSGANFPELTDNMIPVYYVATNNTSGVWKKADSTNKDSSYKWFNYEEQMWANAVTVKASGTQTRDYYLNAPVGTTIEMSDITTMWVWIPRYRYVIFNGNNGTAEEQLINVLFEHGKDTSGTVSCSDSLLNSDSSETCSNVVNNSNYYTHPAFTFGDEELTGFWVGKFESSTDDSTCLGSVNSTNCNKTNLNIVIKPDVKSLRYITISNMFANTRKMESYNNIHGFSQNESATTWLNSSSNLTGEIANDNNQIDTHMIKNMEWGAVAYLSGSKYGKQGNSSYTGEYKEIYINNNSDYKTGYSGGSYNTDASNSTTYLYNNLTTNGEGQGYKGAGASTTGNVYGVFDLSGGVGEYSMGNQVNSSTAFNVASAGTWSTTYYPLAKYYDIYSYSSSSTNYDLASGRRGKLGDATKEVVKSWITAGKWYSDSNYYPYGTSYSWFARGGYYSQTTSAGLFASDNSINGSYNQYYGSRAVLTVSREMPWLNSNS